MTKQQALDQLRIMQAWHEDFGNGPCPDYDAICYAINIIEEAPEGLDNLIKALEQEHKKLLEMQKAQPKQRTGKWVLDRSGAYCCSECMEPCAGYVMMKPRDKFCKMCGAKMERCAE